MHFSTSALVLATLTIGQAVAGPARHAHLHAKKAPISELADANISKRDISATDLATLASLGALTGINAAGDNGNAWFGYDGPYTNEFINNSGEDLILVVWGPLGSWVNAVQPFITASIAPGASKTVSFASGAIGAFSAIYSDTVMSNGQISNTWGEFTFSPDGVVDVSREVNMAGHTMSVVGPECTTDMGTCVFVCSSGNTCMTGYELLNCTPGSQPGAQYGEYFGAPSGGCGGLGSTAALQTYFS